jgi:maltose O-acetyltransferase
LKTESLGQRLWAYASAPPGNLLHLARRAVWRARALALFRRCQGGRGLSATGYVHVDARGILKLGERIVFSGGAVPSQVEVMPGATLSIGDGSLFNHGSTLEVHRSVRIGRRCMLGSFVRISDRAGAEVAPVELGDDVWIAHGAIIGPGVRIGNGAVISAGSVVTQDVPGGSIAMGNPARFMSLSAVAPD